MSASSIRTAQNPARQSMSVRELFSQYGDRIGPHVPDTNADQTANPLRAILGDIGQDSSSAPREGGDGDADWRTLLLDQPQVLDGDGLLFELLSSRARTMSF